MANRLAARFSCAVALPILGVGFGLQVVEQDPILHELKKKEEIVVHGLAGPAAMPVRCDSAGNLFLRFDDPTPFQAPVISVTGRGERKAVFSLENATTWERAQFYDFTIGPGGEVFLLASRWTKDRKIESAILTFREDGVYRDAIVIEVPSFSMDQIAAFSTGEFLVMGWRRLETTNASGQGTAGTSASDELVEPMAFVIDRAGRIVREVMFNHPSTRDAKGKFVRSQLPRAALSLARTASGTDGSIYVLLRTEIPAVFVFPPRAEWTRRLQLQPPKEGFEALDIRIVAGTGLLVQFAKRIASTRWDTAHSIFSFVNTETGERFFDYQTNPEVGGAFACYSGGGFHFLSYAPGTVGFALGDAKVILINRARNITLRFQERWPWTRPFSLRSTGAVWFRSA